ncbi:MAG: DUF2182 domain-containing protein [Pseudomonadota bacterium]
MSTRLLHRPQSYGHWLVVFVAIGVAWYFMYAMSVSGGDGHHAHHGASDAPVFALFVMWALMALAMMLPSFVPALAAFDDILDAGAGPRRDFYALIGGYLVAWLMYAALATALQLFLADQVLIDEQGKSLSLGLNAVLLIGAGLYQFSPLKDACLTQCRMPLTFFMEQWQPGTFGAVALGFRLGVICVACCWALMLVGFAGGVMSLLWMGAATVLMTVEKLPQLGQYITRPLGAMFVAAGVWFLYRMLGQ